MKMQELEPPGMNMLLSRPAPRHRFDYFQMLIILHLNLLNVHGGLQGIAGTLKTCFFLNQLNLCKVLCKLPGTKTNRGVTFFGPAFQKHKELHAGNKRQDKCYL